MSTNPKKFSQYIKLPKRYSAVCIIPEFFGKTGYITHSAKGEWKDFIFIFDDNGDRAFAFYENEFICHDLNINKYLSINPKHANNRATSIKH